MNIIKQYGPPKNLRHYSLDSGDSELFLKKRIGPDSVNRLIEYLRNTNTRIEIIECYDPQSGWHGESFILDGVDLSGNGYCFSERSLNNHLDSKLTKL